MSDSPITKETLEYLANLARIELSPAEEERFLKELQSILAHVAELQSVDTSGIEPMNGGGDLMNIFRADEGPRNTNRREGTEQFPLTEDEYLKIPPVFKT